MFYLVSGFRCFFLFIVVMIFVIDGESGVGECVFRGVSFRRGIGVILSKLLNICIERKVSVLRLFFFYYY